MFALSILIQCVGQLVDKLDWLFRVLLDSGRLSIVLPGVSSFAYNLRRMMNVLGGSRRRVALAL
jgi:hypothetical protein